MNRTDNRFNFENLFLINWIGHVLLAYMYFFIHTIFLIAIKNLRSASGSVLARLLEVEVSVVALGGRGGKPSPRIAAVCATHAPGSMGRTGSVRGIVK